MSVNVQELDEQHRAFIRVLNDLHDTMMGGEFREVLLARDHALAGIEQYVESHFRSEEEYMAAIGYPWLAAHRRLHEEFSARVHGYRAALAAGEQVLNSDLVKAMICWVRDHLVAEDSAYASFAAGLRAADTGVARAGSG